MKSLQFLLIRLLSVVITLSSTPTVAGELDELIGALVDIDKNIADTGFEVSQDSYAFGARKEVAQDTTLNLGIGGRMSNTAEYNLSNNYRASDSQTSMIEKNTNPLESAPMLGMRLSRKF